MDLINEKSLAEIKERIKALEEKQRQFEETFTSFIHQLKSKIMQEIEPKEGYLASLFKKHPI